MAYVRSNPEWTSGKAALPEVLTSNVHPHGAALHSILWNKLTDTLKSQILLDEIGTAADLWKWIETKVAAAATESLHMLQKRLFKATMKSGETVLEYSVRLRELQAQIALGGMDIPEQQMIIHLTRDVPEQLLRAADEVNVRKTSFKEAVAILVRAEMRAQESTSSRTSHNAFMAGQRTPPSLPQSILALSRAEHYCHRCLTKGHQAAICQAPLPHPDAYVAYEKFMNGPRKPQQRFSKPKPHQALGPTGTVSHPILSYRWIVDSGSSDHMSPDFKNFLEYFPMTPEPVNFGNGATGYALGRGNVKVNTSRGCSADDFIVLCEIHLLLFRYEVYIGANVHDTSDRQKVCYQRRNK